MKTLLLLFFAVGFVHQGLAESTETKWDHLDVTWPPSTSLPRTRKVAKSLGWKKIDSQCHCKSHFRGYRYVKNDDPAVTLLFDRWGYIAGVQTRLLKSNLTSLVYKNGTSYTYPPEHLQGKWWQNDGDYWANTAYFVDPAIICKGRSRRQFRREGTGTGLWMQKGSDPITDVYHVQDNEADAISSGDYTEGLCLPTMGMHYYPGIMSKNMVCDQMTPWYPCYEKGKLTAFAFSMYIPTYSTNAFYEHPWPKILEKVMKEVPLCLHDYPNLTTMHFFFIGDRKNTITCQKE